MAFVMLSMKAQVELGSLTRRHMLAGIDVRYLDLLFHYFSGLYNDNTLLVVTY